MYDSCVLPIQPFYVFWLEHLIHLSLKQLLTGMYYCCFVDLFCYCCLLSSSFSLFSCDLMTLFSVAWILSPSLCAYLLKGFGLGLSWIIHTHTMILSLCYLKFKCTLTTLHFPSLSSFNILALYYLFIYLFSWLFLSIMKPLVANVGDVTTAVFNLPAIHHLYCISVYQWDFTFVIFKYPVVVFPP